MNPESPRNGQTRAMSDDSANISMSGRASSGTSAPFANSGSVITGLRSGLVMFKVPRYEILRCNCFFAIVYKRRGTPIHRTELVPILRFPIVRRRRLTPDLGHAVDALIGSIGFEVFQLLGKPRRHLGEFLDLFP